MNEELAASCLEALASPHRLGIFRLLVQAGPEGLAVGRIQEALDIPGSTLTHHLSKLVARGLVHQTREGRNLICCCDYEAMSGLLTYLTENCCAGECGPVEKAS
ncbi:MAG: helix-turn-helix transcriptional regulator [Pseudomonadales bacterium]|nr:helix-turn-helix transcriptional regulator [Pseudomonadales bacterium]